MASRKGGLDARGYVGVRLHEDGYEVESGRGTHVDESTTIPRRLATRRPGCLPHPRTSDPRRTRAARRLGTIPGRTRSAPLAARRVRAPPFVPDLPRLAIDDPAPIAAPRRTSGTDSPVRTRSAPARRTSGTDGGGAAASAAVRGTPAGADVIESSRNVAAEVDRVDLTRREVDHHTVARSITNGAHLCSEARRTAPRT